MIKYDPDLLLINVILWIVMFSICHPFHIYRDPRYGKKPASHFKLFFVLFFIYSVFAFAEHDTYHMWSDFSFTNVGTISNHMKYFEPFYQHLASIVSYHYFLWRTIIWGIAVGTIYCMSKLLKDNTYDLILSIALILPTSYFVATRGSAGHALSLFSFLLLLGNNKLYKKRIFWGLLGIVCSFFLHRSNFLFIFFLIFAYIYPFKLNKKTILISWIAYPFLTGVLTALLSDFTTGVISFEFGEDMNIQSRAMRYALDAENGVGVNLTIYGIVATIINKLPVVLVLIYLAKRITFDKLKIPNPHYFLYKATYFTGYIGMLFVFQNSSFWLHERILFMSYFPMVFILSYVMRNEVRRSKWMRIIILLLSIKVFYTFSYRYYFWKYRL